MPVLGVTGGIATGKSTFTRALLRQQPAELFDADATARDLLENDPEVQLKIRETFGSSALDPEGNLSRTALRELVFREPLQRRMLEAILHPEIRKRWTARAEACSTSGEWFVVDIPLLFETAAEACFDRIIVVGCTPATQRHRLREERGLSDELAAKIIAAQLDLGLKISKADHLIWNDSTLAALDAQSSLLVAWLRQRYG